MAKQQLGKREREGESASGGLNQKDVILIIKANQVPILSTTARGGARKSFCL
jgi:hypothetical protein